MWGEVCRLAFSLGTTNSAPSLAPSLPQNSKCTLPDTLGRGLNTLAGDALSNLLSGLTGISRACPAGSNLLRLNLTTHTNLNVGLLALYATADGKLGLALRLNCYYVIAANATVSITGQLLGIPLNVQVPIAVRDGGLVSCVVQTVTTAIPFTGCLLAGLDLKADVNLPINVRLSPDMSGCTGIIPALTGSLLASLGIDLKVMVPIRAATVYPADSMCGVEPTNHIQPLTVTVMLGQPVDGFSCGSNQKTPFPFLEPLQIVGLPGLNLFQKGYVPPPRMVGSGSAPTAPERNSSAAGPQCFQCRVGPRCGWPGWLSRWGAAWLPCPVQPCCLALDAAHQPDCVLKPSCMLLHLTAELQVHAARHPG